MIFTGKTKSIGKTPEKAIYACSAFNNNIKSVFCKPAKGRILCFFRFFADRRRETNKRGTPHKTSPFLPFTDRLHPARACRRQAGFPCSCRSRRRASASARPTFCPLLARLYAFCRSFRAGFGGSFALRLRLGSRAALRPALRRLRRSFALRILRALRILLIHVLHFSSPLFVIER